MSRQAVVILAGTQNASDIGRMFNGLEVANEFSENGDELSVVFDGAGTLWIPKLEDSEHDHHDLYMAIKDNVGVCKKCSTAFDVKDDVADAGLEHLSEWNGHPSMRSLRENDYDVITF